jgi:hypothetical protein
MQYFTGSKAHNIALRDRAIGLGFKLNEYGLFTTGDDRCVAGEHEQACTKRSVSTGSSLSFREARGEIEAAAAHGCHASSIGPTCAGIFTCTAPQPTVATMCGR